MTSETPAQRLGRLVRARRKALKMTQADVQKADGPSTATLRLIEGGKHTDFRDGTGAALEAAIYWLPGSLDAVLDGGDPTPLPRSQADLPQLPRGVPFGPALDSIEQALGTHSRIPDQHLPMPPAERQLLLNVRSKLFRLNREPDILTEEEARLLKQFLEEDELRTLHTRIDWLPRAEQLQVSALATELAWDVTKRWAADAHHPDSEVRGDNVPEYARPNPLPVLGYGPDRDLFPVQVPIFTPKEKDDVVETETEQDASTEVEAEEVSTVGGETDDIPAADFDAIIDTGLPDGPKDEQDGSGLGDVPGATGHGR